MNRFVTLVDREDFFNTTNKPKVLPNKAIIKITAYAAVMPILILSGMMNGAGGAPVEFVTFAFVPLELLNIFIVRSQVFKSRFNFVFLNAEPSESDFSQSDLRQVFDVRSECGALITLIYRDLFHAD